MVKRAGVVWSAWLQKPFHFLKERLCDGLYFGHVFNTKRTQKIEINFYKTKLD